MKRFFKLRAAIEWYLSHNPARAKFSHRFEPSFPSYTAEDFCTESLTRLYVSMAHAIEDTLGDCRDIEAAAFRLVELGRPERLTAGIPLSPDAAAALLNRAPQTVYKYLARTREAVARELESRGILERDKFSDG